MALVILQVITIDENIIELYCNKDIKVRLENIIDKVLETSWGIGQANRHYQ
jgi:hypothetical protein